MGSHVCREGICSHHPSGVVLKGRVSTENLEGSGNVGSRVPNVGWGKGIKSHCRNYPSINSLVGLVWILV